MKIRESEMKDHKTKNGKDPKSVVLANAWKGKESNIHQETMLRIPWNQNLCNYLKKTNPSYEIVYTVDSKGASKTI